MEQVVTKLTVSIAGRRDPLTVEGRPAWMLDRLIAAGPSGFTTAEGPPGVRVSHYVMLLRRDGVDIETQHEGHRGAFAGRHGRYILRSDVRVLSTERKAAA